MTNQTNTESGRGRTDRVKETVGDAKESVQGTVSHVAAEAREKTSELVEQGREKAHELGDRAQNAARTRADEQKERVTNGIRTFADALRRGCDDLSTEQNQYRPLLNTAADRVEGVSRYLEQRDVDTLTSDVRRFARDHTPLFLGGAFVLGFAASRFLKSSPDHAASERASLGYEDDMSRERFDRMLPETGTADRAAAQSSMESRTGSSAFEDGSSRGGRYE